MTDVICNQKDCIYWRNGECTQSSIDLFDCMCMDYVHDDYTDSKEYQTEYSIATCDGKHREIHHGKRIVIKGVEFFTEDDDRNDDSFVRLTHGRTGAYAGSIEWVKSHWEISLESAAQLPDVTILPLMEVDGDGQD